MFINISLSNPSNHSNLQSTSRAGPYGVAPLKSSIWTTSSCMSSSMTPLLPPNWSAWVTFLTLPHYILINKRPPNTPRHSSLATNYGSPTCLPQPGVWSTRRYWSCFPLHQRWCDWHLEWTLQGHYLLSTEWIQQQTLIQRWHDGQPPITQHSVLKINVC